MGHMRKLKIINILALPGQKSWILDTLNACADQSPNHAVFLLQCVLLLGKPDSDDVSLIFLAARRTAFTIFW